MEPIEFEILIKDRVITKVEISDNRKNINVEQFSDNWLEKPFKSTPVKIKHIVEWLETRCFPESRFGKERILEGMGLSDYNPLDIVKLTHGIQHEDYLWIRFKGEVLTYDDVKIRD